MSLVKIVVAFAVLGWLAVPTAFAGDACSLLTPDEIAVALGAKVTQTIPSVVAPETGCVFMLGGKDQVVLSYFTNPANAPKVKGMKDDPFMHGLSGPKVKDYGNIGCKVTDAGILFSTNCNHYQPWLHIAVQFRPPKQAASMDGVKGLLEKAAARFKY